MKRHVICTYVGKVDVRPFQDDRRVVQDWHLFASDSAQGVVGVKRSSRLPYHSGYAAPRATKYDRRTTMHHYGTGTLVSRFTQRQPCLLSWLLQHILYIIRAPGMGAYHQCATASSIRHYTLYYLLLVPTCDSMCTVCLRIIMFHHSVTICFLAVYHFGFVRRERVTLWAI